LSFPLVRLFDSRCCSLRLRYVRSLVAILLLVVRLLAFPVYVVVLLISFTFVLLRVEHYVYVLRLLFALLCVSFGLRLFVRFVG
jgi:hypothetical protein